jgi:putative AdoMet-dependent methyltransferase
LIINEKFDYIVSSYAIHHITDAEKIDLIKKLKNKQNMDGKIIIADVAFENRQLLKECKLDAGVLWDDNEHYIIFDDFNKI